MFTKTKRFLPFLIILIMVPILLTGCSKPTLTKVRVGEVTHSLFYAPEYVAEAKGYFKKQGLDVQLKTVWGGNKTMTALLSNQIDVALVGSETSIYVYRQGTTDPVINFAQLTQTDGSFLISRKKIKHFKWSDLKGKTLLAQRKGGVPEMTALYVLKKHGINPYKDMKMIQNVSYANIPGAFASGTGDFVQLFEPKASVFEQNKTGYVVASFGKESGHLPYTVFMSKQSYIKKHQKAIQGFTNAIYKAEQWVKNHRVSQIAKVVQPYFKNTPMNIIQSVIRRYKDQGSYATNPIVGNKEWNNLENIMISAGTLKKKVPRDTLVNNRFAEKAMKTVK